MSEVSEKFCEECGKVNEIEARFCKTCGNQFPEINNPQFQEAISKEKMAQKSILPEMGTSQPHQSAQNNSFHPPNQFQQHGSYQRKPPGFPGMMLPTRVWGGKGLIDAILQMFKNPAKTAPELLEDPTAPSPMILVFMMALTSAFITYFEQLKIVYTEIDVDQVYYDSYATEAGIQDGALIAAGSAFIFTFALWYVGSWLLGLIFKGGLPQDTVVKYDASIAMRKLTGYRYVPMIILNLISLVLIQSEGVRTGSVDTDNIFNQPIGLPTSDFSLQYTNTVYFGSILAAFLSAYVLYSAIKNGFRHNGISPALVAIIVVVTPFFGV